MDSNNWYVLGLMSGTSLDGVDLAYVKFSLNNGYAFEILQAESVEYSGKWKKRLFEAFTESGEKLMALDADYAGYLAGLIQSFVKTKGIKKLDLIASHGHTVFHRPDQNYTLQIGNGAIIAAETGFKVISDFRTQDVAFGGQGAPLVPIGDSLLFANYDFCLNLGGFANISYDKAGERRAFDICPINIVLNHYTRRAGFEFDDKGEIASKGEVHENLLGQLNDLPFYTMPHPKSLGYEYVTETVLPIIDGAGLELKDNLRTFNEHAAIQIAAIVNDAMEKSQKEEAMMLVSGGGAFNDFFISRLNHYSKSKLYIPDREIIEFKEALIFAFLGLLRDRGEVNCLQSVTGARKDHSSGLVYEP